MNSHPITVQIQLLAFVLAIVLMPTVTFAALQEPTQQPDGDPRAQAREYLNKGVQAYKDARFDDAIEDFKRAKELDPWLVNAPLYLATAYASQYIPGAPAEENVRNGELAVQEFKEILERDPNNLSAIDGIASILYNMGGTPFDPKKLIESNLYHEKHIVIAPDDSEPHYWIGVIDWSLCYRANRDLRNEYNQTAKFALKETAPLTADLAAKFAREYRRTVDEGIAEFQNAIRLHPDYADAMAYLNLLYRQKADMESSDVLREQDLQKADDLVDQVKAIKRKQTENQNYPRVQP
ncbi:MAG TPA: tetratricopeptide repeat protein [Candidatus Binataceae bacterium]|jgi:tetratricopeptide (TPR) repeat protein|nr:tetratricopeptide repeat protein [Candidatus Binataceae bacterium]